MNNKDIFIRLKSALQNYGEDVEITEGLLFNLKETINTITLYSSSKFKNGDRDSMGNKMYFFNVGNDACINSTKNIEIDSKNIRIHSVDGQDRIKALIYTEKLRQYMEQNGIGLLLNQLSESLPKYGSVIWKYEAGKIKQLNLCNVIFDPAVSNMPQDFTVRSPYIIEKHYLQPYELEKMVTKGWDKKAVEKVIAEYRKIRDSGQNISDILVYEMHTELPNRYFVNGDEDYSYYRLYLVSFNCDKRIKSDSLNFEEVLYSNKEKSLPYKKIDYQTIEGRSLGKGIWEELFDTQIRLNTMKNEKALALAIGSKVIYTTTDETIEKNILKDLMNGDILKVRGTVSPLNVNMQNIALYSNEEASWIANGRGLTNKFEALTGETMPTNTPYKSLARLNEEGSKYFDFIRENIGLFLKDVFTNWIIPDFEKSIKAGDILEILDGEVFQELQNRYINKKVADAQKNVIIKYGIFPTPQDIEVAKQQMLGKMDKKLMIKITEDIKDFDKNLFIDITGESYADNLDNKMSLIRDLSQNAQALQNPVIKKLYDSAAEDMGVSKNLFNI